MKKLKIGIDIDNVISDSYTAYLARFNKEFKVDIQYEELIDFYYLEKLSGIGLERVNLFLERVLKDEDFQLSHKPYTDAANVIQSWLNTGFSIHYITVRPTFTRKATRDWLQRHGFMDGGTTLDLYDPQIHKTGAEFKSYLAKKLKLDVFIEDHLEIVNALTIPVLLLDRPWNRTNTLAKNVRRVKSWQEIEEHFSSWKND